MRIVTTSEMKEIEKNAEKTYGLTEELIIENVGVRAANFLYKKYLKDLKYGEVLFLVGKGNNGSDGLAMARHLREYGIKVRAFILFNKEDLSKETVRQLQKSESYGVKINYITECEQVQSYFSQVQEQPLVVDAIFGTGVKLPLSNLLYDVVRMINEWATFIVSIDIPSGVVGDTGVVEGPCIQADVTLAIGLPKVGHYVGMGSRMCGEIKILDVGLPRELLMGGNQHLLSTLHVSYVCKTRNKFNYKNQYGHGLIIGGSSGLTGALILSAHAALKAGAGLVTAYTWEESYLELVSRVPPEIMTGILPIGRSEEDEGDYKSFLRNLSKYNCIAIGPGLGIGSHVRRLVLDVLASFNGPIVVDADAINALNIKEDYDLILRRKGPTLFTPHIGEFAKFSNNDKVDVEQNPLEILKEVVDKSRCSIVLKSAISYLHFPSGEFYFNCFPNDGMATGGSGDVLTGILAGLLAQRANDEKNRAQIDDRIFYETVCLGTVLHSVAGKHAAKALGIWSMLAGNIIDYLGAAFNEIENLTKEELGEFLRE
ncbi:MAG: NAD(P)H-hydrate dehydratase [Bacteriovoracaceae bacterium]